MWCSNCQQDVPGIAAEAESDAALRCLRCGASMFAATDDPTHRADPSHAGNISEEEEDIANIEPSAAFDAWALEERLRHVKRVAGGASPSTSGKSRFDGLRIDAGEPRLAPQTASPASDRRDEAEMSHDGVWLSFLAWTGITLGVAASTCGAALTIWSFASPDRQELRTIGAPVLLGGQLPLITGLLLQLQLAWRSPRSLPAEPQPTSEGRTPSGCESRAPSPAPELQ